MGYACGLLLLILLPFSTGECWHLLKDLDFYNDLTNGAVGLKRYAEHLFNAVRCMIQDAIDQNLEKGTLDKLSSGLTLVQEVLVKAVRGVTTIKGRSNALLLVLNNLSGIKMEQEKLEMAKQIFSALPKDVKEEVKEFEDGLLQANTTLQNSMMELRFIVQRLYQLKEDNKADKDAAQNLHYAAMGIEVALGAVGVVVFGLPLAPVGILFGINGFSIMKENTDFREQQQGINELIDGYETIYMKTDIVLKRVNATTHHMLTVYSKLFTAVTVAGEQLSNPEAQCELIQQLTEALVKACDTFLG